MTVTYWWLLPVLFVLLGLVLGIVVGRPKAEYDFVSPLLGTAIMVAGILAALAFLLGRWL